MKVMAKVLGSRSCHGSLNCCVFQRGGRAMLAQCTKINVYKVTYHSPHSLKVELYRILNFAKNPFYD